MSKIQDALIRLQKEQKTRVDTGEEPQSAMQRTHESVPDHATEAPADDEQLELYEIDAHELRMAGLLMPFESIRRGKDEFRRIKRPMLDFAAKSSASGSGSANTVMITSALPNAGKSFCSVSLAASISREKDTDVVLVDGDVAKSHITRVLGLQDKIGLIGLLNDENKDVSEAIIRTNYEDVLVLPSGPTDERSTELLASDRMTDILDQLADRYSNRIIIIDSPPILVTSEAQALSNKVAQILVVVEAGVTTTYELEETISLLNPEKAISVVLNKRRASTNEASYGEGYGYYGN